MTNASKDGGREHKDATVSVMRGVGMIPQDQEVPPTAYRSGSVLA